MTTSRSSCPEGDPSECYRGVACEDCVKAREMATEDEPSSSPSLREVKANAVLPSARTR